MLLTPELLVTARVTSPPESDRVPERDVQADAPVATRTVKSRGPSALAVPALETRGLDDTGDRATSRAAS